MYKIQWCDIIIRGDNMANREDAKKARERFVDQPGQWVDITPASVKKRQEKGWDELERLLKKGSGKKPAAKKK